MAEIVTSCTSNFWQLYKTTVTALCWPGMQRTEVQLGILSVNRIESEDLSMTMTKNPSIHTASHCGEKEKDPTVLDLLNLRQGLIPISKRNKMKDHKFM